MNITELEAQLENEEISPPQLADLHLSLSAHYSHLAGQFKTIQIQKPKLWLALKEGKTVGETEKHWSASPEGQLEIELHWEMKRVEKLLSSIKQRIRVADVEAHNLF